MKTKVTKKFYLYILLVLASIFLVLILLNKSSNEEKFNPNKISNIIGRKFVFPDSISITNSHKDTLNKDALDGKYKIITYYDTTGCLSCKFSMLKWKILMQEINEYAPNKVEYIFWFQHENGNIIYDGLTQWEIDAFVILDNKNTLNELNEIPKNFSSTSFLLGKSNEVLAYGNLVKSSQTLNLFLNIICIN